MSVEPGLVAALRASVPKAPLDEPPTSSNAACTSREFTRRAHCLRASDSAECASSTTQKRAGGSTSMSLPTWRNSREWFVTTTSQPCARLRARCRKHLLGKNGQRRFWHSVDVEVRSLRCSLPQRTPSEVTSPKDDCTAYPSVAAIASSSSGVGSGSLRAACPSCASGAPPSFAGAAAAPPRRPTRSRCATLRRHG